MAPFPQTNVDTAHQSPPICEAKRSTKTIVSKKASWEQIGCQQTTINVQGRAGDVARKVRDQEQRRLADIVGHTSSPYRQQTVGVTFSPLWSIVKTRRHDVSRRDRIDPYVVWRPLDGHGLHQADQSSLRRAIGTTHRRRTLSVHRGDADDSSWMTSPYDGRCDFPCA